jgi:hypothetical protein
MKQREGWRETKNRLDEIVRGWRFPDAKPQLEADYAEATPSSSILWQAVMRAFVHSTGTSLKTIAHPRKCL